jgi:putative endonuclease
MKHDGDKEGDLHKPLIKQKTDQRKRRGLLAEELAARHLMTIGYQIHDRNWRCRNGEIDIVAEKKGVLIFVEVRSRYSERFGTTVEAMDRKKQRKVRSIAAFYLHAKGHPDCPIQFDAMLVKWINPPDEYELLHLKGVF